MHKINLLKKLKIVLSEEKRRVSTLEGKKGKWWDSKDKWVKIDKQ